MSDFKIGDYVKRGKWLGFIVDQIKIDNGSNLYEVEYANLQDTGYPYVDNCWSFELTHCSKEEFLQAQTKNAQNLIAKLEKRIADIKETYLEN